MADDLEDGMTVDRDTIQCDKQQSHLPKVNGGDGIGEVGHQTATNISELEITGSLSAENRNELQQSIQHAVERRKKNHAPPLPCTAAS